MAKLGRDRDHMKILPACFVVVGDTVEEAKAKRAKLDSLVNYANAIASLSIALGHDASKFDPDGPLPEIPESNAVKSGRERAIALAKRENLTVRQLAQRLGGYSGLAMVGTPKTIADEMEEWLETEGCDGFTIMFPYLPGGLDDFVDRRRAGIAAARHFPPRVRRHDAAREPRPAAAGQPVLRRQGRGGGMSMSAITGYHAHVYYDADNARAGGRSSARRPARRSASRSDACTTSRSARIRAAVASSRSDRSIRRRHSLADRKPARPHDLRAAETGNALKDHTDHVIWLGPSEPLKLSALS